MSLRPSNHAKLSRTQVIGAQVCDSRPTYILQLKFKYAFLYDIHPFALHSAHPAAGSVVSCACLYSVISIIIGGAAAAYSSNMHPSVCVYLLSL